jgi:hypothetical protein
MLSQDFQRQIPQCEDDDDGDQRGQHQDTDVLEFLVERQPLERHAQIRNSFFSKASSAQSASGLDAQHSDFRNDSAVMAGLDPAIPIIRRYLVFPSGMPATSAGMTKKNPRLTPASHPA